MDTSLLRSAFVDNWSQFDIWLPSNSSTSFPPKQDPNINRSQPTPQPRPWTKVSIDLTTFHTSITQFLCSHGTMSFMSSHATNMKLRNLQRVWWWRPTLTDLVLLVKVKLHHLCMLKCWKQNDGWWNIYKLNWANHNSSQSLHQPQWSRIGEEK